MHGAIPYLPSVAAHYSYSTKKLFPKIPGSTWLHPYQKKSWPVMLCDEDTPHKAFMDSRPSSYVFPAILLGKLIYIWVADVHLRPFDFDTDYLKDAEPSQDALEELRRKAFTEHAGLKNTPAFWKNYILQRSEARDAQRKIDAKRAAPASFNDDDDDITFVGAQKKRSHFSTHKRVKLHHSSKGRRDSHLPTPEITSFKAALSADFVENSDDDELFVREAKTQAYPFLSDGEDTDQEERESRAEAKRAKNMKAVQDNPPDDRSCTIFVGESYTPFQVAKSAVGLCEFLAAQIRTVDGLGSVIELCDDTMITPEEFITIAEYLQKGEFSPRLIESPRGHELEGVVLPEEKHAAAGSIARTYVRASNIQFETLQTHCLDKLKTLHPYTPATLVSVVGVLSKRQRHDKDAESELSGWMVDLLVESFWELVASDANITLARLMRGDTGLRQAVFEKLAFDPAMGTTGSQNA